MTTLSDYLSNRRGLKKVRLQLDIETLQYNKNAGKKKPSKYKSVTYSVAVSYWDDDDNLLISNYSNFDDFFSDVKNAFRKKNGTFYKKTPNIILTIHNGNKYDNHFILQDLKYFYPNIIIMNEFMKNAMFTNELTNKLSIAESNKNYAFLRMVKSKSNLSLKFMLSGIRFETEDSLVKTALSLKSLGKKLYEYKKITKDELKTDFDYDKFDVDGDMTDFQAHEYAKKCFEKLDSHQKKYIRNDVIILANVVKYYSQIFIGFDYSKMTFSSNVMNYYDDNPLAHFQLKNEYEKHKIRYTDYAFAGQNLYDYMKSFYFGGLNFYNDKYVGKLINKKAFNIDLNSSFPNAMYGSKIPYKLLEYMFKSGKEFKAPIDLNTDYYYMYQITKAEFDNLLWDIDSKVIKKMFVKYYSRVKQDYVSINSNTLRALETVGHVKIKEIKVVSYLKYKCKYFGSRDKIADKYFVKTQGKNEHKIEMKTPYEINILDEINDNVYNAEEIQNSKVVLNGLYGLPALRAYFHLFLVDEDDNINSYPNGYRNNERNILFSLFVTSQAFYNFLKPLSYLTPQEIDEYFIYCDTDSLYLMYDVVDKIPKEILNDYTLGSWKIEHHNIEKFYVLNHKKYAFYDVKDMGKKDKYPINVRCGGIPKDSFNLNMPFEQFINTQFSKGTLIDNNKSIVNEQGTISIYPSKTELDVGKPYALYIDDVYRQQAIDNMVMEIRASDDFDNGDIMYIESDLVTMSMNDIYYKPEETKDKKTIVNFKDYNNFVCELVG